MVIFIRFSSRRFLSILIDFGAEMKKLNDNGQYQKAINLYEDQIKKQNQKSSSLAVNQALKACVELGDIKRGKDIHKTLSASMANNTFIQTNLIRLYMKCGDYETSKQIFMNSNNKTTPMLDNFLKGLADNNRCEEALNLSRKMNIPKNEYTYSILFNICAKIGDQRSLEFGKLLFDKMPKKFHNDLVVITCASNMFMKCDDLKSAESLFDRIDRIGRNVVSYGLMMKFYNIKNQPEKTVELFQKMKEENLNLDEAIFVLVIDAFSTIGDLSLSQSLIDQIPEKFLSYPWIQAGLIHLWGKIGLPDKSKQIFDIIEHPDNVTFGAMINAYGLNGMGMEAIELFNKVPSNMLDNAIYICVLNACSHSAFIDQAWKIFEQIPSNQRTPQIYTTMVDATSRVFLFDQAEKLIEEYEKLHKPHVPMYMSILSSCRNAKNILLSEKIFRRMEIHFSDNEDCLVSARVLLANTYGMSGNRSMASNIQRKISQSNMKKVVGCSWTVSNGKVHKFQAHNKSHPNSSEIYEKLDEVKHRLIKYNYKADESWITRELDDDETTESVLFGHSERLAIAFNLIQRPIPTRIQIVKNLRICGDCHVFTKLVAKIYQCEIVVRDTNRIHHFYANGQCSCQDHF